MNPLKAIKDKVKNKFNLTLARIEFNHKYHLKKYILEQNILFCKELGISISKYCNHDIIVSLTTYGERLHEVHLAIESIMEQTMKANRIILWLDYSLQNTPLPKALQLQQKRGLEVKFCEDIRSYKKLIPTLKICPNDAIITIDDDLIYEFDVLENLIIPYLSNPSYIYCHRYHRMILDKNGKLLPYKEWKHCYNDMNPHTLNFPTTGAGTLFPPNVFCREVFNQDEFMNICKHADDVWFKAMSLKTKTLVKKVNSHSERGDDYLENPNAQVNSLYKINVLGESLNDKQINDVFTTYDLYKLLLE